MVAITPYKWKDPASLPLRGEDWRDKPALEDVDPKIMEWMRQAAGAHGILTEAADAAAQATPKAANDNKPLPFLNPADWHGQPVPTRQWFLEGLIPARHVTILAGDGGVGKSLLALQIAAASAMSCETLGTRPAAGRALYLGAEDEADEFHRRLAEIADGHERSLADLSDLRLIPLADRDALLAVPDRSGNMTKTAVLGSLIELVTDFRPGLLVLDTSADLFGGDEIKRVQVRQFVAMLRTIAIDCDVAVLLLSHPSLQGMQSGSGSSGSTAWSNSVRSRLYLTHAKEDEDGRLLTTKKANYGKLGNELKIRWRDGMFVPDDGKPSPAAGLLKQRAVETFRTLLSTINRAGIRVAPTKGVNYAPRVLAERKDAGGIKAKQFEEAMQQLLDDGLIKVVLEGPPSRPRQRLILSSEDYGPQDAES
ncbi:ATPase [Mesorhizobium hawassense]|uniref:ATPase n=1 Tax=Mesorhizobium hawassense TaxID=1209954 RepID=A0A330H6D6_9HYPH|nr:AAA family ATPase [Mesorhizobium hawassense]RAZ84203.1 ATPase [Mesorhizobium hawassense]